MQLPNPSPSATTTPPPPTADERTCWLMWRLGAILHCHEGMRATALPGRVSTSAAWSSRPLPHMSGTADGVQILRTGKHLRASSPGLSACAGPIPSKNENSEQNPFALAR